MIKSQYVRLKIEMEFELLKLEVIFERILGPVKLRSWVYGSLLFSLFLWKVQTNIL